MIGKQTLFTIVASICFLANSVVSTAQDSYRHATRLYEKGMYAEAGLLFDEIAENSILPDAAGYSILCDIALQTRGYQQRMDDFIRNYPYSPLGQKMLFQHALNQFDSQDYKGAAETLALVRPKNVGKQQLTEYLFKRAYCDLENRDYDKAIPRFKDVVARPTSDYTSPSWYALGYMNYEYKNFSEAEKWFEKSVKDPRFRDISDYYILECRFMLQDYEYVAAKGPEMYDVVPADRRSHLARIVSESFLVLGDVANARKFYDMNAISDSQKTRKDWFYSGSVLYATNDFKGAIDNFNQMGHFADSIGQVASYHMASSYIRTKNKVAAMDAFKIASSMDFVPAISEDAFFNYAKLAFDLNQDTSAFKDYLAKYPQKEKGDLINSYIAVAALYNRDYAGAVEAYDKIDELDEDMVLNYMKANYLRAEQLVSNGSYRTAIPYLKAAAYYSSRGERFNQMSRFWLAESYYRDDQYAMARDIFNDLYNTSALYSQPEGYLLTYNIAYCYYKEGNYSSARRWFSEYLGESSVRFRKEALERKADCHFMMKEYKDAATAYDQVLKDYFNVNDIYPYYQAALSYGLSNNSSRKIDLLANVLNASPQSRFYPEALFELGRTYAVKEDDDNAFKCFNRLAAEVKDTTFVAKAYIEMGSLARNQSQFNDALNYYKVVVEQMPLSGYAEDALLAIESIYQTKNQPQEYLDYIESIGKGATKTADERELMIFNSAEQIYLSENYQKALVELQSYLEKYPEGVYGYKAYFYIAESYRNLDKFDQACDSYMKVITGGQGSFVELSMLNFANLSFQLERFEDALGAYTSLYDVAQLENNRFAAMTGMMRSAFKAQKYDIAIANADKILYESRSNEFLKKEADYIKAKSYLATSRRDEALNIMASLATDVTTSYGAEAAYMMILDCYDRGDFEQVKNKVYAFSDAGSDQTYWLAKSFIILGDTFVEEGDTAQAKATFESVRDGYTPAGPEDDVMDNVNMRLTKLAQMLN